MRYLTPLTLVALALSATPALAAPPANDDRAAAQRLSLPANASGTLVDATLEPESELFSSCADVDSSVWYRFTAPKSGNAVIELDAAGDLDAAVDVFKRERSEFTPVDCEKTRKDGTATLDLEDLEGEYLVRVGKRRGSDPGDFRLRVAEPSPPAEAPGKALPGKGVRDSVDRLLNPSDIFNRRLRAGTPYRVSLSANGCTGITVTAPDGDEVVSRRCGGYELFTPERSGRYLFTVESGRRRGTQNYRLQTARARLDDTTPGVFIRNYAKVRGRVNGRLDSVDLYRFDVTRRSRLSLSVSGGPDLALLSEAGRRLDSGEDIERALSAGRYYVAVRGEGKYRLRRISRAITHSGTRFNDSTHATAGPGQTVSLALVVRPAVDGRGVITVERFDPLEGWQFLRRYQVRVSGGRGAVSFTPPSVGRYRARSEYLGSRSSSASSTGLARLRVIAPLSE